MGKSIYDLREMLCEELEKMTEQKSLSGDRLRAIDMLTHSIKSIDTIIAMENSGYSRSHPYSYTDHSYTDHSYMDDGRSHTYMNDGSYRMRDSIGRYSRDDEQAHLRHRLEEMLQDVHSDKEREAIKRCMEQMG